MGGDSNGYIQDGAENAGKGFIYWRHELLLAEIIG